MLTAYYFLKIHSNNRLQLETFSGKYIPSIFLKLCFEIILFIGIYWLGKYK